ncbi:hypothetical protein [Pontibacter cellulosilyticus]|uniref:DKNYY family protein n=1 Tax=Pontibacter cellulosilyticus TaxID=1720253 RepID=A0A923N5F4_9BACT|nr:hypothetical protein [Pontibacter cellulosilyticus]MBC5991816.1 hypothetical protein [Pontibacter cellulosilyticus]
MRKALLFCLLIAVAGIAGCETTYIEQDREALGLDYYPLEIGDFKVYKVVDIKYQNNIATKDSFEMREVVDTTFLDQTNTLNYKIVRSIKRYGQNEWVEDSVMTVVKSNEYVVLTKDNTKYVKFVFPVKEGKIWLGDAFNDRVVNELETDPYLRKEPYTYTALGEPAEVKGTVYPNTVTVVQGKPKNDILLLDDRKEIYAKGIGRVYRLFNRVVYCNNTSCPQDTGYKLNGHERHETLITYGSR